MTRGLKVRPGVEKRILATLRRPQFDQAMVRVSPLENACDRLRHDDEQEIADHDHRDGHCCTVRRLTVDQRRHVPRYRHADAERSAGVTQRSTTVRDRHRRTIRVHKPPCGICGEPIDLWDSVDHSHQTRAVRALMHQRCNQLVGVAEALGPEALDRVRLYLWTAVAKGPDRRR